MKTSFISKRIVLISIVLIIMGIGFNSCKKYEEGPSFSLLTATKRISGTWDLKETMLNGTALELDQILEAFGGMDSIPDSGIDLSSLKINGLKMKFEKDGTGSLIVSVTIMGFSNTQSESTTWEFDDKKDNINITTMGDTMTFEILKLTNKELWLSRVETVDGNTNTFIIKSEKLK